MEVETILPIRIPRCSLGLNVPRSVHRTAIGKVSVRKVVYPLFMASEANSNSNHLRRNGIKMQSVIKQTAV